MSFINAEDEKRLRLQAEYLIDKGYVTCMTVDDIVKRLAASEGIIKVDEDNSKSRPN